MRYAVFADVHSNLEALKAVLDFYESSGVDGYICAGDIVGYGPNPNECVELISKLKSSWIVVGNHDRATCGLKDITWFNDYAQKSILWTRKVLTESNQIYLSELPKTIKHDDFFLVHGSPRDPLDEYLLTRGQFKENLPYLTANFTFIGHSHIPFVFSSTSSRLLLNPDIIPLTKKDKYIINPGSVGQPRDNNKKASCAIFDTETQVFKLIRLDYDISKTQSAMRKARLPAFLTERIAWGK